MGWGDRGSRMLYSLGVNEYSLMGGVSGSVGGVCYSVMFVILKPIGLCETNLRGEFLFVIILHVLLLLLWDLLYRDIRYSEFHYTEVLLYLLSIHILLSFFSPSE